MMMICFAVWNTLPLNAVISKMEIKRQCHVHDDSVLQLSPQTDSQNFFLLHIYKTVLVTFLEQVDSGNSIWQIGLDIIRTRFIITV